MITLTTRRVLLLSAFVTAIALGPCLQAALGQKAAKESPQEATQPQATQPQSSAKSDAAPSKGCMAVKVAGSHAIRNIMLFGIAGAIISKQRYQVVEVTGYPARIGQKFHGNDLQTIQNSGTKVIVLDKHYTKEDVGRACP